ncbi:MAG: hypothetical protein IMZ52_06890 [Actinobacteria bacterium]|nr:hypothetical protein [Actinomycetota bacterium]
MSLEESINNLDRITKEVALEIEHGSSEGILQLVELILDKLDTFGLIIKNDGKIIYVNKSLIAYLKGCNLTANIGDNVYNSLLGQEIAPEWCPVKKAIESRKIIFDIFTSPKTGNKYRTICIPLLYDGVSAVIDFFWRLDAGN